jgi:hypothetical protein
MKPLYTRPGYRRCHYLTGILDNNQDPRKEKGQVSSPAEASGFKSSKMSNGREPEDLCLCLVEPEAHRTG